MYCNQRFIYSWWNLQLLFSLLFTIPFNLFLDPRHRQWEWIREEQQCGPPRQQNGDLQHDSGSARLHLLPQRKPGMAVPLYPEKTREIWQTVGGEQFRQRQNGRDESVGDQPRENPARVQRGGDQVIDLLYSSECT